MKRVSALLAALALALGLSFAVASPAYAVPRDCPGGTACGWDGAFSGLLFAHVQSPGTCYNVPHDNRANSFANNTYRHVQMYKDVNCTGPLLRDHWGNHGPFPPGHSSLFWKPFCCGDGDQNKLTSVFFNTG